jgi:auxin responsive GH3 family protein/jasmonic acid-amino synthetase
MENSSSIHYIESEPVGLTEVEVGKIYEVVITNFAGTSLSQVYFDTGWEIL